jgi:predicted phosphoadenosine phosphosulfate sulfurtransferase
LWFLDIVCACWQMSHLLMASHGNLPVWVDVPISPLNSLSMIDLLWLPWNERGNSQPPKSVWKSEENILKWTQSFNWVKGSRYVLPMLQYV